MEHDHNVLHVVNSFDPAGDVIRCFNELKKHSRHAHELIVRDPHPLQDSYAYEEAELMARNVTPRVAPAPPRGACGEALRRWKKQHGNVKKPAGNPSLVDNLMEWADGVIFHFTGQEGGWSAPAGKPVAFRNINIYWSPVKDKFFAAPEYHAQSLEGYKLISSSHVGARDFMPGDNFRWLPDLIPIYDPLYLPDWTPRPACVSYIKHADVLSSVDFGGAAHQNLNGTPHPQVLFKRKTEATVVIDNVCDGHFGLAGNEALSLGLPCIVFNHEKTREALREMAPLYPPFVEVAPSINAAVEAAKRISAASEREFTELRRKTREWAVAHMNSKRLIAKYWDTFADELIG